MPPIPLSHPIPLFTANATTPAITWRSALSTFKAVDDRVRGGSSTSHTSLTSDGSLLFSGFLDTTTLGGAGFASQRYEKGFPTYLDSKVYSGLEVRVRQPASTSGNVEKVPGGGQHAVTSYVLNLYTSLPSKRPDGRNESSTTYEYVIDLSSPSSSSSSLISLDPTWQDFKPFYRGRPQPSAPPLQPEQVKMWSIMARSDFAQQSGPFELVIDSIWATPRGGRGGRAQLAKRGEVGDDGDEWSRPAKLHGARGFALYAFATVLLVGWTMWALLPQAWLERCGVDWYPSREWAYIIPAWSLVLALFIYAAYIAINIAWTPTFDDVVTMTDSHAKLVPLPRAEDMSFAEARRFIKEGGHPMLPQQQQQHGGQGEGGGVLGQDVYDLPPSVVG